MGGRAEAGLGLPDVRAARGDLPRHRGEQSNNQNGPHVSPRARAVLSRAPAMAGTGRSRKGPRQLPRCWEVVKGPVTGRAASMTTTAPNGSVWQAPTLEPLLRPWRLRSGVVDDPPQSVAVDILSRGDRRSGQDSFPGPASAAVDMEPRRNGVRGLAPRIPQTSRRCT